MRPECKEVPGGRNEESLSSRKAPVLEEPPRSSGRPLLLRVKNETPRRRELGCEEPRDGLTRSWDTSPAWRDGAGRKRSRLGQSSGSNRGPAAQEEGGRSLIPEERPSPAAGRAGRGRLGCARPSGAVQPGLL